ncbi:MAG: hypothetical protein Q9196_007120, partial [Gyalolechia fulgens]
PPPDHLQPTSPILTEFRESFGDLQAIRDSPVDDLSTHENPVSPDQLDHLTPSRRSSASPGFVTPSEKPSHPPPGSSKRRWVSPGLVTPPEKRPFLEPDPTRRRWVSPGLETPPEKRQRQPPDFSYFPDMPGGPGWRDI